ncbi:glycosylhydrolase-like jelly roll fold domain-containing protein [Bacillus sp. JCM 19034]|uniref:glycosylhydrolase-like jelly roll fold domain-containing protein n=1 Tax=Bacillus sp. JCM 19034 TaxID=1481928 RepID=UPI00078484BA|nr:glycosylhydrolase-like jelly roll fold domain-containing protein [Bacillus sp. JCM 19034]
MLGRNAKAGLKPWTGGSFTWYEQQGGKKSDLPALWFDIGRETEAIRKRYEQAVYRRLSTVYYRQLSQWCEQHGIALTGHPAESDDIGLLEHFQIPGQDVVWRWVAPEEEKGLTGRHSTAGKCSADAARHRGRRRNADEVLGVCGKNGSWDLPPGDMKWYFDWLFVRGVNLIIPHAFYYSIDGKRRSHERPPDVGLHSSWWPYYQLFSQYIKRLSWLLTDSVNTTKVAVLCQENHLPWELVKPLFEQQIEFNYFEEALLHSSAKIKNGLIHIEKQSYSTVVIEAGLLLSNETITRLNELITQGGSVFIVGKSTNVLEAAITIQQTEDLIEHLIERGHKTAQLTPQSANIRISHMKKEGTSFYLIVNEGEEVYDGHITLSERGAVERWDAWTGGIKELGNVAEFPLTLQRRESLVVMVDPSKEQPVKVNGQKETRLNEIMILEQEWSITGERIQKRTSNLQSWTEWPELAFYSGSVIYTATFELNNKIQKAVIDFGEVHEIVELSVNGQKVGVKLWAPYTFEVDSMLQQGINKIELKVTNSKANEMDQIALHSGLIGPVKVLGDCE